MYNIPFEAPFLQPLFHSLTTLKIDFRFDCTCGMLFQELPYQRSHRESVTTTLSPLLTSLAPQLVSLDLRSTSCDAPTRATYLAFLSSCTSLRYYSTEDRHWEEELGLLPGPLASLHLRLRYRSRHHLVYCKSVLALLEGGRPVVRDLESLSIHKVDSLRFYRPVWKTSDALVELCEGRGFELEVT